MSDDGRINERILANLSKKDWLEKLESAYLVYPTDLHSPEIKRLYLRFFDDAVKSLILAERVSAALVSRAFQTDQNLAPISRMRQAFGRRLYLTGCIWIQHNPAYRRGYARGYWMPRSINRLSARTVSTTSQPGYYPDGGGLYLQVSRSKSKSWIFRFMLAGRAREMGLGSLQIVNLAKARTKAAECRNLLLEGIDPIAARQQTRTATKLVAGKTMTFSACAKAYIAAHRASWKNAKHGAQWESTIAKYVEPIFGALPVAAVDTALVMKALEPIWTRIPETATRLRGRIESVLDWAKVSGHRRGENPARWRGHLDKLLPKRSKVRRVRHHPALPYAEIPNFMAALREQQGVAPRALEFLILTAARSVEVIGAIPGEINSKQSIWYVPGQRMKGGRDHRVPLAPRAMELVEEISAIQDSYLFPGMKDGQPLSDNSLLAVLERMGRDDVTVHGFRSTFKDWASECTTFQREVIEAALAHVISDKVEAAYRRGDLFEKRRRLMADWANYCNSKSAVRDSL